MSFMPQSLKRVLNRVVDFNRNQTNRSSRVLSELSSNMQESAGLSEKLSSLRGSANLDATEYFTVLMSLSNLAKTRINLYKELKGTGLLTKKDIGAGRRAARAAIKQLENERTEYQAGIHRLFIGENDQNRIIQLRIDCSARARLLSEIETVREAGDSEAINGLREQLQAASGRIIATYDQLVENEIYFPFDIKKMRSAYQEGARLLAEQAQAAQEAAAQEQVAEAPQVEPSVAKEVASAQSAMVEEIAVPEGSAEYQNFLLETLTLIMGGETVANNQDLAARIDALDELVDNTAEMAKAVDEIWTTTIEALEAQRPDRITPATQRKIGLLNLVMRGLNNEQRAEIAASVRAEGKELNAQNIMTYLMRYFDKGARELGDVWETTIEALVERRFERITPAYQRKIGLLNLVMREGLNTEQKGEIAASIRADGKELDALNIMPYLTSCFTSAELTAVPVAQPVTDNSDRTTQLLREFRAKGNKELFTLFSRALEDNRNLPGVDNIRTLKTPQALAEFLTANYESIRLALITGMNALPESSRLKMAEAFQNEPLFKELDQQVFSKADSGVYRLGFAEEMPEQPEVQAA